MVLWKLGFLYWQKNAFEWGLDMIPHSADAIEITQSAANYFIAYVHSHPFSFDPIPLFLTLKRV